MQTSSGDGGGVLVGCCKELMPVLLNWTFSNCTGIMIPYNGVTITISYDLQVPNSWFGNFAYNGAPAQAGLVCAPASGRWLAELLDALLAGSSNPTGPCGAITNLFFADLQVSDLHGGTGTCDVTITN
jgi:hypothetical protein